MRRAAWPPVQRATFPPGRCAGCDRCITAADQPVVGQFPVPAPDSLLLVRFRLCAACLARPELRDEAGLQRYAKLLAAHILHERSMAEAT